MRDSPLVAFGMVMAIIGALMIADLGELWEIGGFALVWGLVPVALGWHAKASEEKPTQAAKEEELAVVESSKSAPQAQPASQPLTKEVYRETIIREIVKIRCRSCGTLFEDKLNRFPHCGAPP